MTILEKEFAEYQAKLDQMIEENKAVKKDESVSEAERLKIKRIYHHLVKKIHPDMNPMTEKNEELMHLASTDCGI